MQQHNESERENVVNEVKKMRSARCHSRSSMELPIVASVGTPLSNGKTSSNASDVVLDSQPHLIRSQARVRLLSVDHGTVHIIPAIPELNLQIRTKLLQSDINRRELRIPQYQM